MMRASDLQNLSLDRKNHFNAARFEKLSHATRTMNRAPAATMATAQADTFTPATHTFAAQTALASAAAQVYTVQSGDTLWGISQRFGTTVARLRELNPAIQNTDLIYPGQQLVISGATNPPTPPPSTGGTKDYVIQAGDTLGAIAQRFNTTVAHLQQLNPWITNPDVISAGATIKVPSDGSIPPPPTPNPTGPLTNEPNHQFSLNETWPFVKKYANQYGLDPHVLAGMMQQESAFKNYLVHRDGTGHGLLGLDDNGLLPDFERWVQTNKGVPGYSAGRGSAAQSIEPEWQIEYAAQKLASFSRTYGGDYNAARVWYAGPGGYAGSSGQYYENLIRGHVANLFANGDPPDQLPPPNPTGTGIFTTKSDANKVFLNQWGPTAYNDKGPIYGWSDCGPTSGAMALEAVGLMPLAGASGASNAIDKVRDAVVGYDSTQSQLMNMTQLQSGLRALGANATVLGGDPVAAIDASLSRGHPAVIGGYGVWNAWGASQKAQGDYLNPWDPKGHFVTVLGKSNDGQYIVGDPLVPSGTITVNADQLRTFYAGGFGVLEVSNPNPPPPPPPPPSGNKVSFQAYNGNYMVAEGGGGSNVNANRAVAGPWEMFDVTDLNGGGLESGDAINIKTQNGMYMVAENGGGGAVNANRPAAAQWEQFRIVEIGGDGHIQDGDQVALQTWDGQHWVCAEGGGGREAVANRTAPGAWETFTYHKQ